MAHTSYGQVAFESHEEAAGGSRTWLSLTEAERDSWCTAGRAVIVARRAGYGEAPFTSHDKKCAPDV